MIIQYNMEQNIQYAILYFFVVNLGKKNNAMKKVKKLWSGKWVQIWSTCIYIYREEPVTYAGNPSPRTRGVAGWV